MGRVSRRQWHRLRHAGTLTAGTRPHFQNLLNLKDALPPVDASLVSIHAAQTHEHGLLGRRSGPVVSGREHRILVRHDSFRVVTRKERSRAVLVDIQAVDFRGPMTGNEGRRENQESVSTHGVGFP